MGKGLGGHRATGKERSRRIEVGRGTIGRYIRAVTEANETSCLQKI